MGRRRQRVLLYMLMIYRVAVTISVLAHPLVINVYVHAFWLRCANKFSMLTLITIMAKKMLNSTYLWYFCVSPKLTIAFSVMVMVMLMKMVVVVMVMMMMMMVVRMMKRWKIAFQDESKSRGLINSSPKSGTSEDFSIWISKYFDSWFYWEIWKGRNEKYGAELKRWRAPNEHNLITLSAAFHSQFHSTTVTIRKCFA